MGVDPRCRVLLGAPGARGASWPMLRKSVQVQRLAFSDPTPDREAASDFLAVASAAPVLCLVTISRGGRAVAYGAAGGYHRTLGPSSAGSGFDPGEWHVFRLGVLRQWRRQGLGASVLFSLLAAGQLLGFDTTVTEAAPDACKLWERLGAREAGRAHHPRDTAYRVEMAPAVLGLRRGIGPAEAPRQQHQAENLATTGA